MSRKAGDVAADWAKSRVLFGAQSDAISAVTSLVQECAEPGWDGDDALAVDPLAASRAQALIRLLPSGFPVPEPAPDPDGAISLDWIRSRGRLVSVSVGPGRRLPFAWIDGDTRGHGVAVFDGRAVPDHLLMLIEKVTGHVIASFRTA